MVLLASLDAENQFTNVVVNETIDIIINYVSNNPLLPLLKINPNVLRKLLLTCTNEVLFYDHLGKIYIQTDGISMVSVLRPIFSNFYMSELENEISKSIKNIHYTKDMLMVYLSLLMTLTKPTYCKTPSKKFSSYFYSWTKKKTTNNISRLDVLIDTYNNNNFITFTKKNPSNKICYTLKFKSECPFRYKKKAIINNLIYRAKLISSTKAIFEKK